MASILFFFSSSVFTLFFVALQPQLHHANIMQLKYKNEIDNLKLSITCPDNFIQLAKEVEVYRVACNPITNEDNFLPNILYDRKKNLSLFDYSNNNKDEIKKCLRCGASFFKTLHRAKNLLEHITKKNKDNSGYNCVAQGNLDGTDGLVKTTDSSEHITLYEFENVELSKKFKIVP